MNNNVFVYFYYDLYNITHHLTAYNEITNIISLSHYTSYYTVDNDVINKLYENYKNNKHEFNKETLLVNSPKLNTNKWLIMFVSNDDSTLFKLKYM